MTEGDISHTFRRFKDGHYTLGDRKVAPFIRQNIQRLERAGLSPSMIRVVGATALSSRNRLDSVQNWDNAYLSFGILQWSAGPGNAAGALPALLALHRSTYPADSSGSLPGTGWVSRPPGKMPTAISR